MYTIERRSFGEDYYMTADGEFVTCEHKMDIGFLDGQIVWADLFANDPQAGYVTLLTWNAGLGTLSTR